MLKTMKTLMFEATLTYLIDRSMDPFIEVSWEALDLLEGDLQFDRTDDTVVLNISSNATGFLSIEGNMLIVGLSYKGRKIEGFIPTASIVNIFDRNREAGISFDVNVDCRQEMHEKEKIEIKKVVDTKVVDTKVVDTKVVDTKVDKNSNVVQFRPNHLRVVK